MAGDTAHIMEIEGAAQGAICGRDPLVVQSWQRCIDKHRLDPARACEAYIVPDRLLREHREQAAELISIAQSGLESLYKTIAGQRYVLLLADAAGIVVEFLGDAGDLRDLRRAGLYLGAEWSEGRAGTCAVGACIEAGEALTIHQTDHFDVTHTGLSCTAAPIYDTRGQLAAVLDLSLLSSPEAKASQALALHLAQTAARRIELANLMAQTREEWVVRFSRSPEFLDVDPEAAISLGRNGEILGMTHAGAKLLAGAAQLDWRDAPSLLQHPVSHFFHLAMDDLHGMTRRRPSQERMVLTRNGHTLFAHAIQPQQQRQRHNERLRRTAVGTAARGALRQLGGADARIQRLQAHAAKLAPREVPILIQGETGTGKEFLARLVHQTSGRQGRFVAVNCAAIPESLVESELFGYAPGAFTGAAAKGRKGLVEEADGGTLFLDEIGDMPFGLQARLLRVLAEREVVPLGSTRARGVQVRVLSASHHPLSTLVEAGRFRQDLFYRLNAATLTLPPLRERADLDELLDKLLDRHAPKGGYLELSRAARAALSRYPWPGNLRELDNVLAVAAILCEGQRIEYGDLPERIAVPQHPAPTGELEELSALIRECSGNISEVARRLGVDRSTVHRRIKRLGVHTEH